MVSNIELGQINTIKILNLIAKFGWLRPQEIAKFIWPNTPTSQKAAERWARNAIENGLILSRKLPKKTGQCLVLTQRGCDLLSQNNIGFNAKSGKDIGKFVDGEWQPTQWWQHDLIISSSIAESYLLDKNIEFFTEKEIRIAYPKLSKYPDFIMKIDFHKNGNYEWHWVEVENARKTGAAMKLLANQLVEIAENDVINVGYYLFGNYVRKSLVIYSPNSLDERGHNLNHSTRIESMIAKNSLIDIEQRYFSVTLKNNGVNQIDSYIVTIDSNTVTKLLNIQDTIKIDKNEYGKKISMIRSACYLTIEQFSYKPELAVAQIHIDYEDTIKILYNENYDYELDGSTKKTLRKLISIVEIRKLYDHFYEKPQIKAIRPKRPFSVDDIE